MTSLFRRHGLWMTALFRRRGLWMTASIALNLFLAGLLIGVFVKEETGLRFARGARQAAPIFSVGAVMMGLPETERTAARRVMRAKADEMRDAIRDLRRAQRDASETMAAEPLDKAALQAALADLRDLNRAVQAVVHTMIEDLAGTLGAADRARLARAVFQSSLDRIPLTNIAPPHRLPERRG